MHKGKCLILGEMAIEILRIMEDIEIVWLINLYNKILRNKRKLDY